MRAGIVASTVPPPPPLMSLAFTDAPRNMWTPLDGHAFDLESASHDRLVVAFTSNTGGATPVATIDGAPATIVTPATSVYGIFHILHGTVPAGAASPTLQVSYSEPRYTSCAVFLSSAPAQVIDVQHAGPGSAHARSISLLSMPGGELLGGRRSRQEQIRSYSPYWTSPDGFTDEWYDSVTKAFIAGAPIRTSGGSVTLSYKSTTNSNRQGDGIFAVTVGAI